MGTKAHTPSHGKTEWHGRHDDAAPATAPGERPGVPSRLKAAREKLRRRSG